jgi:hypothetical protein
MREIKQSARREHVSVSNWAKRRLCEAVRHTWPADYFKLFGALSDSDLSRPHQSDLATDAERQAL